MSFVTHLESAIDGTRLPHDRLQTMHDGRPLWVRYDLDAVAAAVDRAELASRPPTMWRYRELLPVEAEENIVTLGEGMTPVLRCEHLGEVLGLSNLWIKDESQLPTGSFKARGLSMAVSRAKELGVGRVAIPTAGNAGGALAAYAARAGVEAWIFMPTDTPAVNKLEALNHGARAFLVDGLITDCGAIVKDGIDHMSWFDVSTLKEPYRLEGKKTMGLELAEQLGWRLPDVIVYPTGGGTGLIGMWKAFAELEAVGWLEDAGKPRMITAQAAGCAPIVEAWKAGERFASPFPAPDTSASGIRVPTAVGDFMILDAIRESGGEARAAEESRLLAWARRAAELEGISVCPEAGAALAVLEDMVADGAVGPDEHVVVFNTGAAQKYVEVLSAELPHVHPPVNWAELE
jgi:threonine synthase